MKYLVLFWSLVIIACNHSESMSNSADKSNVIGSYKVTFIANNEVSNISDKNITINFNPDGKVNGNNSCNNYGGNYKIDKDKLSFGVMMSTKMFCQENAKIESAFMSNLTDVDGFKIHEDVLILLRGNTQVINAKKVSKKEK